MGRIMKKNLLAIIILALLVVNIALTSIMMFSVVGASQKTSALITNVASILQLEVGTGTEASTEAAVEVSMENSKTYDIEKELTIPLQMGADGKAHYAIVSLYISMNMKDKAYKTYGETIAERESVIKDEAISVIGSYTAEELQVDPEYTEVKTEILRRVQELFDSKFIYKIGFKDIIVQ